MIAFGCIALTGVISFHLLRSSDQNVKSDKVMQVEEGGNLAGEPYEKLWEPSPAEVRERDEDLRNSDKVEAELPSEEVFVDTETEIEKQPKEEKDLQKILMQKLKANPEWQAIQKKLRELSKKYNEAMYRYTRLSGELADTRLMIEDEFEQARRDFAAEVHARKARGEKVPEKIPEELTEEYIREFTQGLTADLKAKVDEARLEFQQIMDQMSELHDRASEIANRYRTELGLPLFKRK